MREVYVWDDMAGAMVPKHERDARRANDPWPRSHLSCPHYIADGMEPVQSMLDGKMYDSKARLRGTYKAAGVTEVGNDPSVVDPKPYVKPRPNREAIRESVRKAWSKANLTTSSPGDEFRLKP